MPVPMTPLRMIVRQYRNTSPSLGITLSFVVVTTSALRLRMTDSTSAKPKAPTIAGIRPNPPSRSVEP